MIDVILPVFTAQLLAAALAGQPVTRDIAGRAAVYLHARTHYGILDPVTLDGPRAVWETVLGSEDLRALERLFARVIWIGDGELEQLDHAARAYRTIIGPADPASDGTRASGRGETAGNPGAPAAAADDDRDRDGAPAAGSLAEALDRALEHARQAQLEQLQEDVELQQVLNEARERGTRAPGRGRGGATGRASGRIPDRGVDRPPVADEVQQARRYATRLRQALTVGTRRVDKRSPGGRFDARAYTRGQAQRQSGRPVTTHAWQITRTATAPIEQPHVGLIIDTSGSMGAYEPALGPICWILTEGLRQVGGRLAAALFGNAVSLLSDGTQRMPLVPGIRTGGGTAFAGDAIELLAGQLEMTNPRRPRFTYVLSDGAWSDTRAGVQKVRLLADHGVPTIHLSIGIAPLSVECERVHVITDPAQAIDQIAADTVAALTAATRRRPTHTA